MLNELESINRTWFLHLNGRAGASTGLRYAALGMGEGLIYLIPALLLSLWLWGNVMSRRLALQACAVTFLALGLAQAHWLLVAAPAPGRAGAGPHLAGPPGRFFVSQ